MLPKDTCFILTSPPTSNSPAFEYLLSHLKAFQHIPVYASSILRNMLFSCQLKRNKHCNVLLRKAQSIQHSAEFWCGVVVAAWIAFIVSRLWLNIRKAIWINSDKNSESFYESKLKPKKSKQTKSNLEWICTKLQNSLVGLA